jgi:hypothetical protein
MKENAHIPPVTVLATFSQTCLHALPATLEIMMNHVKVLERWELIVARQWTRHQEFELPRRTQETIAGVDANLLADTLNHAIHFRLKIGRVVDDVKVRVANPSCCCLVIQLTCKINSF